MSEINYTKEGDKMKMKKYTKKTIALRFLLLLSLPLLLTACTRRMTDKGPGIPPGMTEDGANVPERPDQQGKPDTQDHSGAQGSSDAQNNSDAQDSSDVQDSSDTRQDRSIEDANMNILAACVGMTITQTIEGPDGIQIEIDAQVSIEGIERVSRYRYVPQPFTEETRETLLRTMHPGETWNVMDAAVYDEEKAMWEFVTPLETRWIYQISDSQIPGEQILNHERVDLDIDFTDEGQIHPVPVYPQMDQIEEIEDPYLLSAIGCLPREFKSACKARVLSQLDPADSYSCSYLHVCKTDSEQPYAKIVFKKILDGRPVTVWHNLSVAAADNNFIPIKVWGSLFEAEEIGLDEPILSVEEAVAAMQEHIHSASPQDEKKLSVSKITLEYLAVLSSDGEPEIVPVWRFWPGEGGEERNAMSETILAVSAVSGKLIWEERKAFTEYCLMKG